ncbi:hypothetical protein [Amygdalobacter nucleatus]|uniref:hypothetical protein n=1 Tax=Amygdalobacter nucleatus TaxID=3029274 RepID=UPI00279CB34F|nr:hypothetical protein [Amygdalobacter nucleatus]WEG36961.1 hypothetical protein PYS63_00505 [Amygdalobacter nucleatus]
MTIEELLGMDERQAFDRKSIQVRPVCQELEAQGLPYPVFATSTFILKTVIKSASLERHSASIQGEDTPNGQKNLLDQLRKLEGNEKVSFKLLKDTEKIIRNVALMQVISTKEVMDILGCEKSKARYVLKFMHEYKFIFPVSGKGKGKYMLNSQLANSRMNMVK